VGWIVFGVLLAGLFIGVAYRPTRPGDDAPPRAQVVEDGTAPRPPGERLEQAVRSAGRIVTALGTIGTVVLLAIVVTFLILGALFFLAAHGAKGWG